MSFKIVFHTVLLAGVLTISNSLADSFKTAQSQTSETAMMTSELKAVVKNIDHKTRKVTLLAPDGEEFNFVAGERIKNLDQVKKGDVVSVNYTEAVLFEVKKGGKAMAPSVSTSSKSARPGANPQGVIESEVTTSVVISEIDRKAPSVTVKDADGDEQTFKVRYPERLKGVNVGDTVDITYKEALALKLEKASKL